MFRPDIVKTSLTTRIGWKQPTTSGYDILTGDNLISLSGMYFSDYHAALTIKNIKETQENENISDSDFNTYLLDMQKSAIVRVLNGVFNKDAIIYQCQLYSRAFEKDFEVRTQEDKFVGFRFSLVDDYGFAIRINSISLLFNEAKTFNLYCYHSAKGRIWTKSVTTVANQETIVNVTDLILTISESTYKQGEFYIGYFENDLGTCKAIEYGTPDYESTHIFHYTGIEIDRDGSAYDKESITYTFDNYGLNIELTEMHDYTSVICRNADKFDEAVGLQMAVNLIEQIISSSRSNATERIGKDQLASLYNDLNIDMPTDQRPYSAGLKNRLKREIQRLNRTFFKKGDVIIC
jgi:hypothetical protein